MPIMKRATRKLQKLAETQNYYVWKGSAGYCILPAGLSGRVTTVVYGTPNEAIEAFMQGERPEEDNWQ